MKRLLLGTLLSAMTIGFSSAQMATTTPSAPGTSMGAPATANPVSPHDAGKPAASGDTNQAVVTTGANADQPAKGRNSFTMKQATKRISAKGFTEVTGLKKDHDGVWRGMGTKDGQPVQVWLDYKGNVGQQS